MFNVLDPGGRSFSGLLLTALFVAAGISALVEAQACPSSVDNCAYSTSNPCASSTTCAAITLLNLTNGAPPCVTGSGATNGLDVDYFITTGNPVANWYFCQSGTTGSCASTLQTCENIDGYWVSPCVDSTYCGSYIVSNCLANTANVCPP
jgi:hypothetical protein